MTRRVLLLTLAVLGGVVLHLQARQAADSTISVRAIVVTGNERTKEHVILREMSLKPGVKLTQEAIEHDQKRIYSLQLFNKVNLDYTVDGNGATVFVHVSERWYFFPFPILGFKYRDTKKLYYGAGVVHENFRGRNEKIVGSFALGFDRWVSLAYQNPKLTDGDDIFFRGYTAYTSVRSLSTRQEFYDQRVLIATLTAGKRIGLYHTLLGIFGYERWNISEPREGRTASADGVDRYFVIGTRYYYDTRDIREYAGRGVLAHLFAVKLGLGGSEVDLLRYGYDLRGYAPLNTGIVLGGRTFGTFVHGGVAPPYQRTYFGYDERLRGHFTTVLEGERVIGSSVELRVPILSPQYVTVTTFLPPQFNLWRYGLYAGIFADAGKTWYRSQGFGSVPWYSGYGAGLHFLLPYSIVVRTEYAFNNFGKGEFVLDFGASF